eukprot:4077972-Lingulodinium_polyedra.AAC.1
MGHRWQRRHLSRPSGKGLLLSRDTFDPEWSRSVTLYRPWLQEPHGPPASLEKLFDRRRKYDGKGDRS